MSNYLLQPAGLDSRQDAGATEIGQVTRMAAQGPDGRLCYLGWAAAGHSERIGMDEFIVVAPGLEDLRRFMKVIGVTFDPDRAVQVMVQEAPHEP
jgi:hypothetical protein